MFSAGAASTMKCFVAGTMIFTASGLVAIENIRAGNKVISTNSETFEVAEKSVLETYIRETTELVHLTINEALEAPVKVYNFQVEDFHTYHVGENGVLVHNADYDGAVNTISKDSKLGRETKGKTEQKVKSGGFDEANVDFDSVNPQKVNPIDTKYGSGRTGSLDDGSTITVRPGSSDGRPTVEIRKPNGRGVEIRYGE